MEMTLGHANIFLVAALALVGLISLRFMRSAKAEAEPKPEIDINSQHVAAITAAILAATHGRGRILNIVPHPRTNYPSATQRWRSTAIVESVGRRLAPSWKR